MGFQLIEISGAEKVSAESGINFVFRGNRVGTAEKACSANQVGRKEER